MSHCYWDGRKLIEIKKKKEILDVNDLFGDEYLINLDEDEE